MIKTFSYLFILVSFLSGIHLFASTPTQSKLPVGALVDSCFLDNGIIKVGVDLNTGGCIFYVGYSDSDENFVNHRDNGRYIQQSFYGERDGSTWAGKPWSWNPIQGGGCGVAGNPKAKVVSHKLTDEQLYVWTMPKHWATGNNVHEIKMEQWITISDSVVHVKYKAGNIGKKSHPKGHCELPAIFLDHKYGNLVLYKGKSPWTNDTLYDTIPPFKNRRFENLKEQWAAYVDDNGYGIGFYFPESDVITTYRRGDGSQAGTLGRDCSYLAPVRSFEFSPGAELEYDLFITVGTVGQIRNRFYKLAGRM